MRALADGSVADPVQMPMPGMLKSIYRAMRGSDRVVAAAGKDESVAAFAKNLAAYSHDLGEPLNPERTSALLRDLGISGDEHLRK